MKDYIFCECGMLVTAANENHLKVNLTNHKKSKKHKVIMKIKEQEKK